MFKDVSAAIHCLVTEDEWTSAQVIADKLKDLAHPQRVFYILNMMADIEWNKFSVKRMKTSFK